MFDIGNHTYINVHYIAFVYDLGVFIRRNTLLLIYLISSLFACAKFPIHICYKFKIIIVIMYKAHYKYHLIFDYSNTINYIIYILVMTLHTQILRGFGKGNFYGNFKKN